MIKMSSIQTEKKMSCKTALRLCAFALICHGYCRANEIKDEILVNMSKSMCEPCSGQVSKVSGVYGGNCPRPTDLIKEAARDLSIDLKTTRDRVLREKFNLKKIYEIPDNFTNLVHIDGLSGIESSSFGRLLPKDNLRNRPKRLLHLIYIRTLLFSAYTDALSKIYTKNSRPLSENINSTTTLLRTISCTTNAISAQLGIKIKKKITKKLCKYEKKIDPIRSRDYETSILGHGQRLLQDSEKDLQEFVELMKTCRFNKCESGSKLKLKCKNKKEARSLQKSRNSRKNTRKDNKAKKGRKDKKCGNNKKKIIKNNKIRCIRKGRKSRNNKKRNGRGKPTKNTHNNTMV